MLFLFLFACSCGNGKQDSKIAQGTLKVQSEGMPVIRFDSPEKDLGTVSEGEQLVAWYEYTNSGTAPLVIQDIRAGCGCTVPRWEDTPLAPGGSGSIRVVFNSKGKRGTQNIRITVRSNAENDREELYLKAKVENKP